MPCRAVQRFAVQRGAAQCCVVLCGAVPCSGMLCLYFVRITGYLTKYHHASSRLSSAWLSSAAQRRAVLCGAVCCGAVPCCFMLCFVLYMQHQVSSQVPGTTGPGMWHVRHLLVFGFDASYDRGAPLFFLNTTPQFGSSRPPPKN